jgi:uncharacterized protein YjiS (DUF1127 family)
MDMLNSIGRVWTQRRAFRAALAELERLSDRELGDRGLARGDIPRVAYEEGERCADAFVPSYLAPPAATFSLAAVCAVV